MSGDKVDLDGIDRKILNLLQRSNLATSQEIADQVGISQAACHRRIRRLRDKGVITADVSLVDSRYGDRKLIIWVEITLSNHQLDLFNQLLAILRESLQVSCCDVITGDTDILACVHVRDMEEFVDFTRDLMRRCPIIKTYRSLIVSRHVKMQPSTLFDETR